MKYSLAYLHRFGASMNPIKTPLCPSLALCHTRGLSEYINETDKRTAIFYFAAQRSRYTCHASARAGPGFGAGVEGVQFD